MEVKDLIEQINKEWYQMREILETRDKESAEVKSMIQTINNRLDELEAKINKVPTVKREENEKSPEYKGFIEFLRTGRYQAEYKAVTDTSSGYILTPPDFEAKIIEKVTSYSPIRDIAFVRKTTSTEVKIPKEGNFPSFGWVGLAQTIPTATPTPPVSFKLETIPVNYISGSVPVYSFDLQDSAIDLEEYLIEKFADKIAETEGKAFVAGTGVGQPEGILSNPEVPVIKSGDASTIPSADVLYNMLYSLHEKYARRAVWIFNRATLGFLRTMKDTIGRPLWDIGGLAKGEPETILGRPYVICPDMPNIGAGSYPIVLGDFKTAYYIVDKRGMQVKRDDITRAKEMIVEFIVQKAVGGQVVVPEALVKLQIST